MFAVTNIEYIFAVYKKGMNTLSIHAFYNMLLKLLIFIHQSIEFRQVIHLSLQTDLFAP